MLAERYRNDGKPLIYLSKRQREAKAGVEERIKAGRYRFESVPCPICAAGEIEPLAEKDRCGLYAPTGACRACGLVRTSPRMDEESYREYYRSEYRVLQDRDSTPRQAFTRERIRGRRLIELLETHVVLPRPLEEMFVVEVGCGAGGILKAFAERGARARGLDIDASRFDVGRAAGLDLVEGTLEAMEASDPPDLLIYSHVLEHVLTPNTELARARELVGDGGLLYVEVPGLKHLESIYEGDFLRYLQNAHVWHFSRRTLLNLVEAAGFEALYTDERVRAILRIGRHAAADAWVSDYEDALVFLRKAEESRPTGGLRALARGVIVRLGLMDAYRRVRSLFDVVRA